MEDKKLFLEDFMTQNPDLLRDLQEAAIVLPQRKYGGLSRALLGYAAQLRGEKEDLEPCVGAEPIVSCINKAVERIEESQRRDDILSGIPTGYAGLDRALYGLQPGSLVVIASRPSVGKTAFVLTMVRNMAVDHKIPVLLFSCESPDTELVTRMMVSETGLEKCKLFGGTKMSQDDWGMLHDGLNKLSRCPLFIESAPGIPVYELARVARKFVSKHHVQCIVIDGLQLLEGPARFRDSREQEVTAICRVLKELAVELEIPVVVTSQINRNMDRDSGYRNLIRRPQLSDLRESGAIEQIADVVLFIHRPEFVGIYDDHGFPGETDLIVAKYRNGEVQDIKMRFLSSGVKFVDYNDSPPEENASYSESRMNDFPPNEDY